MASFTPKYKLEKPAPEDFYDITVFNANMDKVEEALGKKPDRTELPAEVKKAVQDGTLTAADLGAVSAADKGKPNGVAGLGSDGKVPQEQLPEMDYDAAGSAAAVDKRLDEHAQNKNNPHGVTAAQVGAPTTAAFNGHTGDGVKHVTAEERQAWNAKGAPYRHTFTLTAAGWAGTPAKQTVTVSGVTAALTPVADVVLTGDAAADKLILEGWGKVSRMVTGAGNVTATCYEEKPGVSLPVQLVGCK